MEELVSLCRIGDLLCVLDKFAVIFCRGAAVTDAGEADAFHFICGIDLVDIFCDFFSAAAADIPVMDQDLVAVEIGVITEFDVLHIMSPFRCLYYMEGEARLSFLKVIDFQ
jgi:hypothetical protein